jgi:hypothetical protein
LLYFLSDKKVVGGVFVRFRAPLPLLVLLAAMENEWM